MSAVLHPSGAPYLAYTSEAFIHLCQQTPLQDKVIVHIFKEFHLPITSFKERETVINSCFEASEGTNKYLRRGI